MNFFQKQLQKLIGVKNTVGVGRDFLRFGLSGRGMTPTWEEIRMSDKDFYTGYSYAAIKRRANLVALLSQDVIELDSQLDDFQHPYWEAIASSPYFSQTQFFSQVSTYLDLEGVYYLFLSRGTGEVNNSKVTSDIKYAKLMNPYTISRKLDKDLNIIAYEQQEMGMIRTMPPEMVLEFRQLSPFDWRKPYGMTDANRGAQYSLKTSQNFTNQSLSKARGVPYIVNTDEILDDEKVANLKKRLSGQDIGEPIVVDGSKTLDIKSAPTNLKEAMLKDINEGSREELFSVAGLSKTLMGIEQSGTTRETAKVQKDLFIELEVLSVLQLVADTINLDYRSYYPKEFEKSKAVLKVINPTATDHDAEIKKVELKDKKIDLVAKLVAEGYDEKDAVLYVSGELPLDLLKKKANPQIILGPAETEEEQTKKESLELHRLNHTFCGDNCSHKQTITPASASLKNSIIALEGRLVLSMTDRLVKKMERDNQLSELEEFDEFALDNLITKTQSKSFKRELAGILVAFYLLSLASGGQTYANERKDEFGYESDFDPSLPELRKLARSVAEIVSDSHVDTVIKDVYSEAFELVKSGASTDEIVSSLTTKFSSITRDRAELIAQTEAVRAENMTKFEADRQMIEQNQLEGKVFKSWQVNSNNPCVFCLELEAKGEIPFDEPWLELGETMVVDNKNFSANFEAIYAGLAHPRCQCTYNLRVRT